MKFDKADIAVGVVVGVVLGTIMRPQIDDLLAAFRLNRLVDAQIRNNPNLF